MFVIFIIMVTEINILSISGIENIILMCYYICLFLFWLFVFKNMPEFKFDKENLVDTGLVGLIRLNCLIWFSAIFYLFSGVLLASTSETYLESKLVMTNILVSFSLFSIGIPLALYLLKKFNRFSGFEAYLKDVVYEIKTGGKK